MRVHSFSVRGVDRKERERERGGGGAGEGDTTDRSFMSLHKEGVYV